MHTDDAIERVVLVVGCSSVLSALALLITLLLPGPFTEPPTLIALNFASLSGLIYPFVPNLKLSTINSQSKIQSQRPPMGNPKSKIEWPSRTVLLILLAIVAVAAITRLTRLGYAEFHEDELENMRLLVRAYKGEEYASFLDSKGPIHWLLPGALWYLNGWVNEGIARTPFVIAAMALVPLMFALGRRMSGGKEHVGLIAAGFVAMNGFFVALARHVENRALIVFWGALAVWFIYRYYRENRPSYLIFTALTLAIGLIAHPNVLLYLPAVGYIIWQNRSAWRRQWPWLLSGALLFAGLTAFFYVPYLLDPEIGLVYQYFAGERVGDALLNNLVWYIFV
jgi:hypothetical protein